MTPTDLDQQLSELQARHTPLPGATSSSRTSPGPEVLAFAVNFTCDFDAMLLHRLLDEPPMQLAKGEFAGRIADGDGNAILDLDVTGPNGGGMIEINTVQVRKGGPLRLRDFAINFPAG